MSKTHQHKKIIKGKVISSGFPHPITLSHRTKRTKKIHDDTLLIDSKKKPTTKKEIKK